MEQLLEWDFEVFKIFNGLAAESGVWDYVFVFFSEQVIFILIALLAVFVLLKRTERARGVLALQALAAAFVGRAIIVSILRIFFFRPRPFADAIVTQLVPHSILEGSWPSGHAAIMFALAFTLLFKNVRWGTAFLVLAAASSTARIIVGVHYPLDILGGVLVGGVSATVMQWGFGFWVRKKIKD